MKISKQIGWNEESNLLFQITQYLERLTRLVAKVQGTVDPTKTSDLLNDSGFITIADVPSTTNELTNDSGFITGAGVSTNETDPLSLHTDQTAPQTLVNGIPLLESTRNITTDHQLVDKYYVDTRPTGGVKSWYFTKTASDIAGMYVAQTALPLNAIQTIAVAANDGETTIAEFLTPLSTPDYRVIEGMRFFYVTAKVSHVNKVTQLRGEVWLTDLNGANGVLLRTSSPTIPLTIVDAEYVVSVYGESLFIDHTTTRVLFKIIAIKEVGGVAPTVTLTVDDDTFSRLDVPSPVGVTELIAIDDTHTASINNVGKIRYRVSGTNSYCDMVMQTSANTYAWINIIQNNWT